MRLREAAVVAEDAYHRLRTFADRLTDEMDEVTAPHGVPVTDLDEEDSLVISVRRTIDLAEPLVLHDLDATGSNKK